MRLAPACWLGGWLLTAALNAASVAVAPHAAAATSSPIATRVALNTMRDGGSAIDGAIAAELTLAVVQPQRGNIGGGGFLLYFEKKSRSVWALDFREAAPASVPAKLSGDGGAVFSCVPSTLAGLQTAHARFGKMTWTALFAPAISLAHDGFEIDLALRADARTAEESRKITRFASTKELFFANGRVLDPNSRIVQEKLAKTLSLVAERGTMPFYDGPIAKQIVSELRANGSKISLRDLRDYKPIWRAPIRIDVGEQQVYTMGPPSSGGIVLAESIGALHLFDLVKSGAGTAGTIHLLAEMIRRGEIDSRSSIGDPDRARILYAELLSAEHLEALMKNIDLKRISPSVTLQAQGAAATPVQTDDGAVITVADTEGNVACLVTSLGSSFGSGFLTDAGFFINDSLRQFDSGAKAGTANAIEAGKRPASSNTPVIVVERGIPRLAYGSNGGRSGSTQLLKLYVDVTIFGKSLAEAIDAPRFHQSDFPDELLYEDPAVPVELMRQLIEIGHSYRAVPTIGAVQAIANDGKQWTAVADTRGGGAAGGY